MIGNPVHIDEMVALLATVDPTTLSDKARAAFNKLQASVDLQRPLNQDDKATQHDGEAAVADCGEDHAVRIQQGMKRLESAAPLLLTEVDQLHLGTIYTAIVGRGMEQGVLHKTAVTGVRPYASEIFIGLKAAYQVGYGQRKEVATRKESDGED